MMTFQLYDLNSCCAHSLFYMESLLECKCSARLTLMAELILIMARGILADTEILLEGPRINIRDNITKNAWGKPLCTCSPMNTY